MLSYFDCTLSSVSSWETLPETFLVTNGTAHYRRRRERDTYYDSSSLTQVQKFAVYALSSDVQNNIYSGFNAASGHLGPRGKVVTRQKWYHRRPWKEGIDDEVSESAQSHYNIGPPASSITHFKPYDYMKSFVAYNEDRIQFGEERITHQFVKLGGEYDPRKENRAHVIVFIHTYGMGLRSNKFFFDDAGNSVKMDNYEVSRHSYT